MLPFEFDYYKPVTLQEAVELFQTLDQQGKQPMFFSGGTELITLGRIELAYTEAVIDIKDIRELQIMQVTEEQLILGSALTLTKVEEANLFPLLTKTASEVADHTARGKITLGGNICAQIFYREAVLPFLLADSQVVLVGPEGVRVVPINDIFHEQLQLGAWGSSCSDSNGEAGDRSSFYKYQTPSTVGNWISARDNCWVGSKR